MLRTTFSKAFALLLSAAALCTAQVTTATFYGAVNDPTAAVISGADVSLLNEGTQAVLRQTSDSAGEFAFNFVPVGTYTLRIEARGFKIAVNTGLKLSAGESVRRSFNLEVGAVSEIVEVEATTPLVNTVSPEQRETITTAQVQELPLSRRNVAGAVTLTSGVTRSGGDVYLNGSGRGGTSISVDGTDATSNPERPSLAMFGDFNYINGISIEAVGELQITKGVIPAEYTRSLGGNVNIITRSGTNQFHGSLFENFRADDLNARNQFLRTKPPVTFNQFGGSIGGPIIRNRIFAFGVYEGYRERAFQPVSGNVPTQRLRDDLIRSVPAYKPFLDLFPLPNQPHNLSGITGQFIGAGSLSSDENHFVIKPDVRITDNATASVTWARFRPTRTVPRVQEANFRSFTGKTDRVTAIVTLFRSRWTSESRYGYNNNNVDRLDGIYDIVDAGQPETSPGGRRIPCIYGPGFGDCGEIGSWGAPNHSFDQKFGFVTGRHSFKFGGVYFRRSIGRQNIENPQYFYNSEADLLANVPNTVQFTFGVNPYTAVAHEFGLFIQDDWRINPRLTINLGLRYDYFGAYVAGGAGDSGPFSFNRAGFIDSRFTLGPIRPTDSPYDSDKLNLGPRVGFSYNPDGRSKTVIRGGASTMFTNLAGETFTQTVQNSLKDPFRSAFSRQEAARLNLRYPAFNQDVLPLVSGGASGGSPRVLRPDMEAAYAINLYLGIQRELFRNVAVETAYVANRGVKWQTARNANLPDRFTGARPNPAFATIDYWDNSDNTWYNAWQTSVRQRYSNGLTANVHYTWSKALSFGSGDTGWVGSNAQDFFDLRSNRGLADGSILHSLVADIIYETPRLTGMNGAVRHLLGGYQISSIFNARSGSPINITQPTALSGSRPDYAGGPVTLDDSRSTLQYLNRAAFQRVPETSVGAAIRAGNLARNAVFGPGLINFDIGIGKNFAFAERVRLQVRADMLNAFNHTNYSGVDTNIKSASFGRITGTNGAREVQLSGRFSF